MPPTKDESRANNPILPFLAHQRVMLLDGGLATALESYGCDLDHDLWSARVLLDAPDLIRRAHRQFLEVGADCIATASYQATVPGLRKAGLATREAEDLLRTSVRLAAEVRDRFWSHPEKRVGRLRPLVAASIGPYGAYLADGSEYTGDYGLSEDELYAFHHDRWRLFAESEADLLACETIPSLAEARALLRLLGGTPDRSAWISFSCRDETRLSDGSTLFEAARACDAEPGIAAIGVNCTAPDLIPALISEARRATEKPVMVYPNSGEGWDAVRKSWTGPATGIDWAEAAHVWVERGAAAIGGCCRVTPADIAQMRRAVVPS